MQYMQLSSCRAVEIEESFTQYICGMMHVYMNVKLWLVTDTDTDTFTAEN